MYVTCPVARTSKGGLEATDSEAWEIHATKEDAMKAVQAGLLRGDKLIALFQLDSLFKVKELQIETTE